MRTVSNFFGTDKDEPMLTAIFNRFELDSLENQKTVQKLQQEFKINLSKEKIIRLFLNLALLEKQDNSSLVKTAKQLLVEDGCNFKLSEIYEIFSKLIGEKNWNIVQGNKISLYDRIFNNPPALPTGISRLDEDLLGGLRRGELVSLLGSSNSGKLTVCINWAKSILQATNKKGINRNLKVLHVCLQNINLLSRYQKSLGLPESETPIERLKIFTPKVNFSEEDLYQYVKETYQTFQFDVLLVHGQLLDASKKPDNPLLNNHRVNLSVIFRKLCTIAQEFNAVVISPIYATKRPHDTVLKASDIPEAFEIASLSSVIVTLNSNSSDSTKRYLILEKQRRGKVNIPYLISTDFNNFKVEEIL